VEDPRVGVLPIQNLSGTEQHDTIAAAIYETTLLTLRIIGEYELVELENIYSGEEETEEAAIGEERLLDLGVEENLANIVFGVIAQEDGRLILRMSVFDTLAEEVVLTRSEESPSLLDVFDATDALVADVVGEFSGVPVGFGELLLENRGEPGDYSLYIDGTKIGENVEAVERVLIGRREVEINQERMLGEVSVFEKEVEISAGEVRELELFEEAEGLLENIDYSPALAERRRRFAEIKEAWLEGIEEWRLEIRPRWIFPLSVGWLDPINYSEASGTGPSRSLSYIGAARRFWDSWYFGLETIVWTQFPIPLPTLFAAWRPGEADMLWSGSMLVVPGSTYTTLLLKLGGAFHGYSVVRFHPVHQCKEFHLTKPNTRIYIIFNYFPDCSATRRGTS